MTMPGFRSRTAISLVGTTVASLLTIGISPTAYADQESWGAIAVTADRQHIGVSKDMPNEIAANEAADFNCRAHNCNVMISFKYPECGAVVTTEDQFYRDLGNSQQEAEQNAINQSPKVRTRVLRSACNDAPSGRP